MKKQPKGILTLPWNMPLYTLTREAVGSNPLVVYGSSINFKATPSRVLLCHNYAFTDMPDLKHMLKV